MYPPTAALKKKHSPLGPVDHEDGGSKFFHDVSNYLPFDMAQYTMSHRFLSITACGWAITVHTKIKCDLYSSANIISLHTDIWNK